MSPLGQPGALSPVADAGFHVASAVCRVPSAVFHGTNAICHVSGRTFHAASPIFGVQVATLGVAFAVCHVVSPTFHVAFLIPGVVAGTFGVVFLACGVSRGRSVGAGLTTRSSEQAMAARFFCWLSLASPWPVAELGFVRLHNNHTTMKAAILLGAVLTLTQCSLVNAQAPSQTPLGFNSSLKPTLAAFTNLPKDLTFDELVRRAGQPDKEVGSGVFIWVYQLADGSTVSASSGDAKGKRIDAVTHVVGDQRTSLYIASR